MFEKLRKNKTDYPPSQQDGSQEESAVERAPKPEALNVNSLVDKAIAGDVAGVSESVASYIDAWKEYATDNNIFFSKDVAAMRKFETEITELAGEVAKIRGSYSSSLPGTLKAKLEELTGPMAQNIEAAVTNNEQRIEGYKNATPAEQKTDLADNVEEIQKIKEPASEAVEGEEQVEETSGDLVRAPKISEAERNSQREARAAAFAEKFGIMPEREALLAAEKEYFDAVKAYKAKGIKIPFRENESTKEQQYAFDAALFAWRNALAKASESGDKHEKVTAKFISARDTMMRMERVRQEATVEALDEKSQTAIGKMQKWAGIGLGKAGEAARLGAKGATAASEFTGGLVIKNAAKLFGIDQEKHAEKIQKASRILGSAAIMTAIAAPLGAATAGAAGTAFLFRTMRGTLGAFAGTAAGYLGGGIFNKLSSKERLLDENLENKEQLLAILKNKDSFAVEDGESLQDEREAWKKGNEKARRKREEDRERRQALVEKASAALVAGVSAYEIAQWGAVQEAAEVIAPSADPVTPPTAEAPDVASRQTPDVPPVAVKESADAVEKTSNIPPPATTVAPEVTPPAQAASSVGTTESAPVKAVTSGAETAVTQPEEVATAQAPVAASTAEYVSPIKNVIPLPEGMDPDSPEATAFLNKAYNPEVFAQPPIEQQIPSPATGPEAAAVPDEQLESPSAESAPPAVSAAEAAPEPQDAAEATPSAAESSAGAEAAAPVQPTAVESVVTPDTSSGPTELIEQPIGSGFEKGVTLESLEPDQYVNKSGVTILPKEPHVYELDKPKGMRVLWGGTAEEQMKIIEQYLQESANQQRIGVPINVFFPDADGKPILISYALDKDGNTVSTAATNGLLRRPVEFAGTDSFRAKID